MISSADFAPVRSRMVLIAIVEPCRNRPALGDFATGFADAGFNAVDQCVRRGECFAEEKLSAGRIERRNIGESAADIGGNAKVMFGSHSVLALRGGSAARGRVSEMATSTMASHYQHAQPFRLVPFPGLS